MKRIFIVHGWDGSSNSDWLPWATAELRKLGYEVSCPDMPHPEAPIIEDWVSFLSKIVSTPDEDTYFIGHSIGCQAIMRFLETIDVKVGGAIFVAGWFDLENLEGPESEAIAKPWLEASINTEKVRNNLGFSVVLLGDDDDWVPYEKTKEKFERLLSSEVIIVPNGGHFDDTKPLPLLLDVLKKKIS